MRTIIDLPDNQITALHEIEARHNLSRAHIIRQAVAEYLVQHVEPDDAFGTWKAKNKKSVDGQKYQEAIRSEWDR